MTETEYRAVLVALDKIERRICRMYGAKKLAKIEKSWLALVATLAKIVALPL